MTEDEIARVEAIVNFNILAGADVETVETDIEGAKAMGAMALFGEKYGSVVRAVKMGEFSTELCGGTHVSNTAKIGLFKIISESSVAAGVRRIVATTGEGVLKLLAGKDALIAETAKELKVQKTTDLAKRAAQLQSELHDMKRELDAMSSKLAASKTADILKDAKTVGSLRLVTARLDGMALDAARNLGDDLRANNDDLVSVIAVVDNGKLNFVVSCGKAAVSAGAHAGKLAMGVASVTGGKGGGRPDGAVAGGKDASLLEAALAEAEKLLSAQIG